MKCRQAVVIALFGYLILALAWFDSSQITAPPKPAQTAEKTSKKGGEDSYLYDVWEWATHDAITVYTFFLAVFTGVVGVTAIVQIRYLRKSDENTRVAALAAKRSADAAVNVELPILIMSYVNLVAPGRANFAPNIPIPEKFRPVIQFTNYGRSPAEITSGCLEWTIAAKGADLPLPPPYRRILPYSNNAVVLKDGRIPLDLQLEINLSAEQVSTINESRQFLWFYGFIAFNDFLGEPHESRFCTKWAPFKEGEPGPFGFVWDSDTPAEYTKRT